MATERIVTTLMSKKLRVVIHCPSCPISPNKFEGNKKTACMHLRKAANRKERRHPSGAEQKLIKDQQCEWYVADSIKKLDNGISVVSCDFI